MVLAFGVNNRGSPYFDGRCKSRHIFSPFRSAYSDKLKSSIKT